MARISVVSVTALRDEFVARMKSANSIQELDAIKKEIDDVQSSTKYYPEVQDWQDEHAQDYRDDLDLYEWLVEDLYYQMLDRIKVELAAKRFERRTGIKIDPMMDIFDGKSHQGIEIKAWTHAVVLREPNGDNILPLERSISLLEKYIDGKDVKYPISDKVYYNCRAKGKEVFLYRDLEKSPKKQARV